MAEDKKKEPVLSKKESVDVKKEETPTTEPIKVDDEVSKKLADDTQKVEAPVAADGDKKPKKKKQKRKQRDTNLNKKLILKEEKSKKKKRHNKEQEEDEKEKPVIDEKLVLEEEKPKKIKAPKKVKPKTYKESQDKAKKLFKHRLKFTKRFFRRIKSKAKGKIDVLINRDYMETVKRAKMLLGISEKDYQQQILITVPNSFSNHGDVKYHLEVDQDGTNKLYFDQAHVTVLFYGVNSLFIYQCHINHRSGFIGHDRAQEFKYTDVISVETVIKFDNDAKPKYSVLNAELTLINNQKFSIHLRNQRLHDQLPNQPLLSEKEQHVLQMLKNRIRAHKV